MEKNILHSIFFDEYNHWDKLVDKYGQRIREVVQSEVNKFRHCGEIVRGFRLFVCEGCNDVKKVAFRCKGKFCPTCAMGETQRWSEAVAKDMYKTVHRHIVFTIDEGLRKLFLLHREKLLKGLMDESAKLIKEYFNKKGIEPGITLGLHTFGSKLEFNPHIHMIVTMGGLNKQGEWEDYDYIPFKMLRVYWQNAVLKLLRRVLTPNEKREHQHLLQKAYSKNAEGFYVNAPKRSRTKILGLLQYIGRYMKRGPIALSRIKAYDGGIVAFVYHDKRTNKEETLVMSVEEFILSLVRHIPEKGFKMIRHYGLYSRRIKTLSKKIVIAFQEKVKKLLFNAKEMMKPKSWRERIIERFKEDPLKRMHCGNYYEFKGTVAPKNGRLKVVYANDIQSHEYLKREIKRLEEEAYKIEKEQTDQKTFKELRFNWQTLKESIEQRERELYLSTMWERGIDSYGSC